MTPDLVPPRQDVSSAGMLDITGEPTVSWLRSKLRELSSSLSAAGASPDAVVFYVDSGNAFHMPTYFQFAETSVSHSNPDFYREAFVRVVSGEVTVVGVSSAASRCAVQYTVQQEHRQDCTTRSKTSAVFFVCHERK